MARPRVYSYHIRCPACGSNWMPKHGTSKGRQVYRCGDCGRCYIPDAAYTQPSAADKERGLALHGDGVSLSAIARTFGVTPPAVSRWVKKEDAPRSRECAGGDPSARPTPRDASRPP